MYVWTKKAHQGNNFVAQTFIYRTENIDEYSIFELQVRPTIDFQQELIMNGDDIEVLEPSWLRKDIAGTIKRMWNKYKEDKWCRILLQ